MKDFKSIELYKKACQYIPGGVNSPVRAFKSVNRSPLFIKKALGSHIYDADGNNFIDYVASWGPMILGHAHPEVINALIEATQKGTSFGAPIEKEIELAELISQSIPSIEKIRLVNSGTEATMSAIRLARAYTKREKFIKFEGCYHGHADSFLIKAGSGATTLGHPSSPGVTENTAKDTLTATFNDIESVEKLFLEHGENIAAIIVEPIPANMGVILPDINFLKHLRKISNDYRSLLIFDEVITGFRISNGGAQEHYQIFPDITTLGKIIGGGLPIGAYGGKAEIMNLLSPEGPVYQAGTLSGNPLAVTAGLETLKIIIDYYVIKKTNEKAETLISGFKNILYEKGLNFTINAISSMCTLFFTDKNVIDYKTALSSDTSIYSKYFRLMLDNGIYLAPSQFEASFVSHAHTDEDISRTLDIFKKIISEI